MQWEISCLGTDAIFNKFQEHTKYAIENAVEAEFIPSAERVRSGLYMRNANTVIQKNVSAPLYKDSQRCINSLQNASGCYAKTKYTEMFHQFDN